MDKLINYEDLGAFRQNLVNDSATSELATWSSDKINTELSAKQGALTAGANISISGNTISATDTVYQAGANISISGNTISAEYEIATTAEIEALFVETPSYPARNQLWYTTSNGQTYPLSATNDGASDEPAQLTSNVYQNGKGIATFDCERIGLQYTNSYDENSTLTAVWLPYITEEGWMINMFGGQENLTNIYYPGTVDELADVFEWSGALYNSGTNIIHCSDGDFEVPAGS